MPGEHPHPDQQAVLEILRGSIGGESLTETSVGYVDLSNPDLIKPASNYLAEKLGPRKNHVEGLVVIRQAATPLAEAIAKKLGLAIVGTYDIKDPTLPPEEWQLSRNWIFEKTGRHDQIVGEHGIEAIGITPHLGKRECLLPLVSQLTTKITPAHFGAMLDKNLGARTFLINHGYTAESVVTVKPPTTR